MNRTSSWKAVGLAGAVLLMSAGVFAQTRAAYDKNAEITVKGTVASISLIAGGTWGGEHLNVRQSDGNIIDVHIGPRAWRDSHKFNVASGDQVEATGSKATFLGSDAVLAREIKKGGQTLQLRDDRGYPLWMTGGR